MIIGIFLPIKKLVNINRNKIILKIYYNKNKLQVLHSLKLTIKMFYHKIR